MKIYRQTLQLMGKKRGFHLITTDILQALPQIKEIKTGICHVFIQHTSASIMVNENADPTVRKDFEMFLYEYKKLLKMKKEIVVIASMKQKIVKKKKTK